MRGARYARDGSTLARRLCQDAGGAVLAVFQATLCGGDGHAGAGAVVARDPGPRRAEDMATPGVDKTKRLASGSASGDGSAMRRLEAALPAPLRPAKRRRGQRPLLVDSGGGTVAVVDLAGAAGLVQALPSGGPPPAGPIASGSSVSRVVWLEPAACAWPPAGVAHAWCWPQATTDAVNDVPLSPVIVAPRSAGTGLLRRLRLRDR